jgi:hypothetical protein
MGRDGRAGEGEAFLEKGKEKCRLLYMSAS